MVDCSAAILQVHPFRCQHGYVIAPFADISKAQRETIEVDGEQSKNTMVQLLNIKRSECGRSASLLSCQRTPCKTLLTEMEQDLQSAIFYAGGRGYKDSKHVDELSWKEIYLNVGTLPPRDAYQPVIRAISVIEDKFPLL